MQFSLLLRTCTTLTLGLAFLSCLDVQANDRDASIQILQRLKPGDQSINEARQAMAVLQKQPSTYLLEVLSAMDGSTPLGRNWLTTLAVGLRSKKPEVSRESLEAFLKDQRHDGEARYLVFSWLTENQPELRQQWLDRMLDDSSPEIRYDSVAQAFQRLTKDVTTDELSKDGLKAVLDTARHPNQVVEIIAKLKEAGVEVHQANHFGFLDTWHVIGPFDNAGQAAFNQVYPVEEECKSGKFDEHQLYQGKSKEVAWQKAVSEAVEGVVDLNPIFEKEKGAIAYARTVYASPVAMACQLRLGCINAHKVWVNGQEVMSNEVYHASMAIDQYIADIPLKAGENVIVLKVCQNEQTEPWAQDWKFQLRLCDTTGKSISSK